METITSFQNPKVKNILLLQEKSRERKRQGLFVVEGKREILLALEGGYNIHSLFLCGCLKPLSKQVEQKLPRQVKFYDLAKAVFDKLAYREDSDGLIAVVEAKSNMLDKVRLSENPFIVVLEAVEKPGNLGAILRTVDAAQVDAVVICDPLCDVYNPNAIRSSVGCLFTLQIAVSTSEEVLTWLKHNGIKSFAAELQASRWYHEADMSKACAVIMGTEANGLTDFWLKNSDARIKIPMRGKIDSLNVSVSTAVLTFEAMRQRGFK
ncbi:MAG: RNA methyltransferase [Prevotellaceae bacterium]|jgi:TrmH family RNA methyltransferase|nr:RNA methyltransferase [Prevotellaceae bacterium]